MLLRYYFEMIVGLIAFLAVLFLGKTGNTAFVLFAALPLIMRIRKNKVDERELYVFYKAGNLTMGLMIASLFLINQFSDAVVNGNLIGDYWFPLSVGAFLASHGFSGLIMSRA